MKKRITALLLAFVLILSLCPTAFATAKIGIDKTTAMAGEQVVVTLTNETELTDITNLDYRVYYDKDCFTFTSGDDSEVLPMSNDNQPVAFDNSIPMHDDTGDYIAVNVVDSTSEGLNIAVGTVYTLTFTVKPDLTSQQRSDFEMVRHSVMDTTFKTGDDVDPALRERVKVTGDVASVTVKPLVVQENYAVKLSDDFIGADMATPGADYTFSARDLQYDYTITAIMGDEDVSVLDNGDGTYTIKNVSADLTITATKTLKSDDKNHTLTKTEAVAVTCTEDGNNEYWTCKTCGKYFSDDAGNAEIAENSWMINATGHSYDAGKVTKAATCATAGEKLLTCRKCNATKREVIPPTGKHTVVTDKAIAATYAKTGLTEGSHCSVCGKVIKAQEVIPKLTPTAPAAPTLSISRDDGKIKLSWNAVSGATKYYVYRSTNGTDFPYYGSTTGTTYTNSSVTSGTRYYYKVKAVNTVDGKNYISVFSNARNAIPMTTPTMKAELSTGVVKLSWNAVTGATKYWIYRSTDGVNYTLYNTVTGTSYTNNSVTAGKTYYYKVRAVKTVNSVDWASSYSAVSSVKILSAPTVNISRVDGKIKLSWNAVPNAAQYYVYRSTDGTNFKYYGSTTGTTYTNSSVTSGTRYYYKVKAVNSAGGTSVFSTAKNAIPMATPTVSATISSGKVKLSWNAVTGATKYWIYRSTDGVNYTLYNTVTGTSYTNNSVTAGKTYYYKVRAVKTVNSVDWASDYSNVVSKKP